MADVAQRSDLIICLGGHDRARQENVEIAGILGKVLKVEG